MCYEYVIISIIINLLIAKVVGTGTTDDSATSMLYVNANKKNIIDL